VAVKAYPDIPSPDAESWTLTFNTQTFTSDLNGAIQTAELPGARWSGRLTYSNRTGADAGKLRGFLAANKGRAGRFYVTPSDAVLNGSATQNGTLDSGATAGAITIEASGFAETGANPLLAGDYFEINGELKIVTDDVAGTTINFSPPLRKDVTLGQTVRVIEPRVVVMLSDDDQASWQVSGPIIYNISFDVVEPLDI
jgi:hypothetical protein